MSEGERAAAPADFIVLSEAVLGDQPEGLVLAAKSRQRRPPPNTRYASTAFDGLIHRYANLHGVEAAVVRATHAITRTDS